MQCSLSTHILPKSFIGKGVSMPIIFIENHYPLHKNKEALAAWLRAIEKYPQPEGLFTTLVDMAVSNDKNGLKVLSAHLINSGKYDEASLIYANL
jgi:hypothetical protein